MLTEREYYVAFSACSGIGPVTFDKLLSHFISAQEAWTAEEKELEEVIGVALVRKFIHFRNEFSIDSYIQKLTSEYIAYLTIADTDYPPLLRFLSHAPFVLYCKGNKNILCEDKAIAVVGTRMVSSYGRQVTQLLTDDLVRAGMTIVSGLALGVDSIAHETTLQANGSTIAVLGCGVACCTPSSNIWLYNQIIERGGVIISEFAFNQSTQKGIFPARNRIIAGLSQGVLVTEGKTDSGALITAQRAFELGRPVFAVPGPITSQLSRGPLDLIGKGAKIVSSGQDVLDALSIPTIILKKSKRPKAENELEESILVLLEQADQHIDDLVRSLRKDIATISTTLGMMEITGKIKNLGGGKFAIQ